MFNTSKETFIETLKLLRLERCAYSLFKQSKMCDCKFRNENADLMSHSESGNGCPELYFVIEYIKQLSDEEFLKLRRGY